MQPHFASELCFPKSFELHSVSIAWYSSSSEVSNIGVSLGTPNTISAYCLSHSFISKYYTHGNGHQTMVPLVYGNHSSTWQKNRFPPMQSLSTHFLEKARMTT